MTEAEKATGYDLLVHKITVDICSNHYCVDCPFHKNTWESSICPFDTGSEIPSFDGWVKEEIRREQNNEIRTIQEADHGSEVRSD